ncbi:SDR family NAD(P)-dependent oxidoreductase [Fusobacterium sp. PH5-44]|uniref:SDR family NAD(P)-dependent oxidoreductase n=1 Tax=unclassified Fusobacterium TaxID=2648384 RepID=UPI003D1C39F0
MKMFDEIFSLKGQNAIITGGATGLGFAMAKCIINAGANVIIVGIEKEDILKEACKELGPNASYYQFDITNTNATPNLIEKIIEKYGKIQILINNAGIHCKKTIEEMSVEDFTSVLNVHIVASFALTKALIPHMKENKKGSIIFISSMTGFLGQPYVTGYSAAKSAVLGMVRTLATEVSSEGIRINAIAPGWIETPMLHKALDGDPERKNKILGRTPMKKFGKPEDIGWAAVYLCSNAASFVNGVSLIVDGGALIGF